MKIQSSEASIKLDRVEAAQAESQPVETLSAEPSAVATATIEALSFEPHSVKTATVEPLSVETAAVEPLSASMRAAPSAMSMAIESPLAPEAVTHAEQVPDRAEHQTHSPAGTTHNAEEGYSTVQVYYATDRQRGHLPLSSYELSGNKRVFVGFAVAAMLSVTLAGFWTLRGRTRLGALSAITAGASSCAAVALIVFGQAHIEKHGVTYTGDRGQLTRGVCQVTIPDRHQVGIVERPSLLKFEVREDQGKHIVMTSAVELLQDDFQRRISAAVHQSADRDLLVFIHGFNVDFESAVLRTAQMSVDLPFEGVPICYSWPSQGTMIGYPIDANNAEWTVSHLKEFLLELAEQSGADSINVVAHSMGNRAMTAAMQQISWQTDNSAEMPFDQIVMAAPDVDADRFRIDLAPALVNVANQITLYASSDDKALVASKGVNGYPRAGDSGDDIVIVPGIETVDVSGIDLTLLGHSYYGDNESMLRDLYDVVRARLPAAQRKSLIPQRVGTSVYWQLAQRPSVMTR